jgi:imidazolonepropionase-like amidohydrolase
MLSWWSLNRLKMEKFLGLIIFILFISASPNINDPEFDLIIANVSLIDGTGKDIQSGVNVYVKDSTIAQIGRNEITQSRATIDGSGKYLIPGLFDAHYHLQDVPNDTAKSSPSLKQLIHFGVTGVLIPGGSLASYENLEHLKQLEASGEITSPHLFYTSLMATIEGSHPMKTYGEKHYTDSVSVHIVKDANHIRSIVQEASRQGAVGIKIMIEDGPMAPYTTRMPQDYINTFSSLGKEYGLPVFAHVSDMTEVKMGMKGGVDAFMHFM